MEAWKILKLEAQKIMKNGSQENFEKWKPGIFFKLEAWTLF